MTTPAAALDLDRLLELRLVVTRFFDLDFARWSTSEGVLCRHGAVAPKRKLRAASTSTSSTECCS